MSSSNSNYGTYSPALPSFLFLLADDIGWGDFSYNNGTALTPNIDAWAKRDGSVLLQDFHSGGTVCSPTRATILTGRHHFRDCVDFVYGCSDMSQCVPNFEFAPSKTFTVGDAVRTAFPEEYDGNGVFFAGKWHLGSFFNDSEAYGGTTSSPLTHGFNKMNATIEVAPTATLNCQCKAEWKKHCKFGHYHEPNHCFPEGECCFNYWWDDPMAPHGVTNLTWPTPLDDSLYLADAFSRFLEERSSSEKPFLAQISFHHCHIPFIASEKAKRDCAAGKTCRLPEKGEPPYTDQELDYYACLTELDNAVGIILRAVQEYGYYNNTMIWFATDNGPEHNCPPLGLCQKADTLPHRPVEGPGSSGPLRGRKRDIYEGGHRVPGVVSYPSEVRGGNHITWETVTTMDFLPTVMEILKVERPENQRTWAMDGRSILPLLRNPANFTWKETTEGVRSLGIAYRHHDRKVADGWGFRFGPWKYVHGSMSCTVAECQRPQLYNLEDDLGERHDLSAKHPYILANMTTQFNQWFHSVSKSRHEESKCRLADLLQLPGSSRTDREIN
ncbi:sulfatase [Nitzschia inconspicua]|uniref:Sulfatase n=1 Tax=Nitzschia inconspicua TaxID=303405 RepID=A0A9K3L3V9_9STRA|nr:sulfatase [Nitzschia inconspicua]